MPINDGSVLIGQGANGKVYLNEDGTVTKVVVGECRELLPDLYVKAGRDQLDCVARVISRNTFITAGEETHYIVKERIEQSEEVIENIRQLVKMWDDSLVHMDNLFGLISYYLQSVNNSTEFSGRRSTQVFLRYLQTYNNPKLITTFCQLVHIVDELKYAGIYDVDWNEENFGLADRGEGKVLTMFELGEAKYKKK